MALCHALDTAGFHSCLTGALEQESFVVKSNFLLSVLATDSKQHFEGAVAWRSRNPGYARGLVTRNMIGFCAFELKLVYLPPMIRFEYSLTVKLRRSIRALGPFYNRKNLALVDDYCPFLNYYDVIWGFACWLLPSWEWALLQRKDLWPTEIRTINCYNIEN